MRCYSNISHHHYCLRHHPITIIAYVITTARSQLAYDADFPFDADVCDAFNEKMCGLEFPSEFEIVDSALESLSSPPKFEPVEYEKAEYEKAEYMEGIFEEPE